MVNKAMIVGRVGKDAELSATQNGNERTTFSVATSEKWKAKDGTPQEKTVWHNVCTWGPLASVCAEYVRKGMLVFVEGKIDNRQYEKDGVQKSYSEIVASNVRFLSSKNENNSGGQSASSDPADNQSGLASDDDEMPF